MKNTANQLALVFIILISMSSQAQDAIAPDSLKANFKYFPEMLGKMNANPSSVFGVRDFFRVNAQKTIQKIFAKSSKKNYSSSSISNSTIDLEDNYVQTNHLNLENIRTRAIQKEKTIQIEFNKNIETVWIIQSLWSQEAFPYTLPKNPVKEDILKFFREYKQHKAVVLAAQITSYTSFNALNNVVLQCSNVPLARIQKDFSEEFYGKLNDTLKNESGRQVLEEFISEMNKFYIEAKVDSFLNKHAYYYKNAMIEVKESMPQDNIIATMEQYYKKSNRSYYLIPSLTAFAMGMGTKISFKDGDDLYQTIGARDVVDSLKIFGFTDKAFLEELSIHEYGHSFINYLLEKEPFNFEIKKYRHLFEPIKEKMGKMSYNTWETCFAEHLVRTGEIRIALRQGNHKRVDELRRKNIEERKFIYIPFLEKEFEKYEKSKKSFEDYFPSIMKALALISSNKK